LSDLQKEGVHIEEVQMYSIARKPAREICNSLKKPELEAIAAEIRSLCDVNINVY